jgi:L-alanine-DL-glutamate epimerase-like enolase superfamily enzyme
MATIAEVRPVLLSVPLPPGAVRWAGGSVVSWTHAIVRLRDTDECSGLGEMYAGGLWAPEVSRALLEHFGALLVGASIDSVDDIDVLVTRMRNAALFWGRGGITVEAISALENAMLDVLGKRAGRPVVDLLGGVRHARLPLYASGGLENTPDELAAEIRGYCEAGYRRVKIRVGWGIDRDLERMRVARDAGGADLSIAVDAVKGHDPRPWSSEQALSVVRALQLYEPDWFEEPCAATDIAGYAAVRRGSEVRVAGGESTTTVVEFQRFLEADALDISQPDAAFCGGILELRRIAALCAARGQLVAPHSWGSPIILAANYHAGFSIDNCATLEMPTYPHPLRDVLWVEPPRVENGMIAAPRAPGLGVELDTAIEREFRFRDAND